MMHLETVVNYNRLVNYVAQSGELGEGVCK